VRARFVLPCIIAVMGWWIGCQEDQGGFDDGTGDGDGDGDGRPSGATECIARFFADRSVECTSGDCGAAMICTSDIDCISCSDRCTAASCNDDAGCAETYGDLCDDVEWRCEPYITTDDYQCNAYDPGATRCGDGDCNGTEVCEGSDAGASCREDCGYCDGQAPAMAACDDHAECESGECYGWCLVSCSSGWDCVGNGQGVLYGDCVVASDGYAYCFPNCSVEGGCAQYPGVSCQSFTDVGGFDVHVCSG
jgi:hypothetical protein